MNRSYMTPSRKAVLSLFCSHPHRRFTAEQVCTLLCQTNREGTALLGKSTVYRQLAKLCEEGQLSRTTATDSAGSAVNVYAFVAPKETGERRFCLQCRLCGRVTPLDCEQTEALVAHLSEQHGFWMDGDALLCGVCGDCQPKQRKED